MRRLPERTTKTREECLRRAQECEWHAENSAGAAQAAVAWDEARWWRSLALVAQPAAPASAAPAPAEDPFNLQRFVEAQASGFDIAMKELRDGRKRSHWMWFIFPQLKGLGRSPTAQFFGISGQAEAEAYLRHPLLGPHLKAAAEAANASGAPLLRLLFGSPDDLKFRSSMTLFARISDDRLWQAALDRWCGGERDPETVRLLDDAIDGSADPEPTS